jgi:NADH-quinone oxidoreductase subunit N
MALSPPAIALLTVVGGGVGAVVADAFWTRRVAVATSAVALAIAALLSGYAAISSQVTTLWGVLAVGGFMASVSAAIYTMGALAVFGGWDRLTGREWGGSLAGLVALGAAASAVVSSTRDVTVLLIGLETAAASAYALVSVGRARGSREAAMKYFVQGSVASALFVFAMAVVVGAFAPTGDLMSLRQAAMGDAPLSVLVVAVILLLAAIAFKSGAAPFHAWVPDAYETASPEAAAYFASSAKIGVVSSLVIVAALAGTGSVDLPVSVAVAVLAVLSVLVGSVTALAQRGYTRMLAYAGVAQVGYALIAIAMHDAPAALFFVVSYAIASAGAFLAASAFEDVRPGWDGSIEGLTGLARTAPGLAFAVSVLVISLVGIPPLIGFWGKLAVFASALVGGISALSSGGAAVGWIGVVTGAAGVIGSVVSLGYYGKVLRVLYEQPAGEVERGPNTSDGVLTQTPATVSSPGSAARVVALIAGMALVVGLIPLFQGVAAATGLFS